MKPDRRQRHQQGRRRALPPGLQQRVRRPRVLAAPHQRLRSAPAAEAQPAGIHRLVHPAWPSRTSEIQIFGDGSQVRDFVYVDDAVDAFLRAGFSDDANGRVINVGGDEPISHRALVEKLIDVCVHRALPPDRVASREARHRHRQLLLRFLAHRRARSAGVRGDACATACSARWRSTARTSPQYVPRRRSVGACREHAGDAARVPFVDLAPRRRRRRHSRAPSSAY